MEFDNAKHDLLKRLRNEVARFYRRDNRLWKEPVVSMLRSLQQANLEAVFFGGTLRSLLVSRVIGKRQGRPRDIDIVISGGSIDCIREFIEDKIERETRFGGVHVREREWHFDLWPLERTWAFVNDAEPNPAFTELPKTTFLNMEAIAVEVWPKPGKPRQVYTGDEQFFDGLLKKLLEINREDNPFPALCVVRALVMASHINFDIGPKLARYIVMHGEGMTCADLRDVQQAHYGRQRQDVAELRRWIRFITNAYRGEATERLRLPIQRQRQLWPSDEEAEIVRLHAMSGASCSFNRGDLP